jgi:hypothetical protein
VIQDRFIAQVLVRVLDTSADPPAPLSETWRDLAGVDHLAGLTATRADLESLAYRLVRRDAIELGAALAAVLEVMAAQQPQLPF